MTGAEVPAYEALRAERPADADTITPKSILFYRNTFAFESVFPSAGRSAEGFIGGYFNARLPERSRQNRRNDLPRHIRQPIVPTLIPIDQFFVVDAEEVERRRVQVVDMNRVLRDVVAEVVRHDEVARFRV